MPIDLKRMIEAIHPCYDGGSYHSPPCQWILDTSESPLAVSLSEVLRYLRLSSAKKKKPEKLKKRKKSTIGADFICVGRRQTIRFSSLLTISQSRNGTTAADVWLIGNFQSWGSTPARWGEISGLDSTVCHCGN
ncbi:hypothetical protein CEXT_712361 [Caerostris extrusa]|uniref:Uncharacterized protein n=1 Tax=Caerostris extrusa TaxID=172846 RepID=A0AAV4VR45_CAEEX|nr:hypothetical protein CEXT_712361 [Caerostris extrusa]